MKDASCFDPDAIKSIAIRAHIYWATGEKDLENMPSPCSSVCVMNAPSGWCRGCLRTLEEIGDWSSLDEVGKRQVWKVIGQRAEFLSTR
jgi:uncharacterized protein